MNKLWDLVNNRELSDEGKIRIFLFLNCFISGCIGVTVWWLIKNVAFNSKECAICFACYAAFFLGYVRGFIFLCKQK